MESKTHFQNSTIWENGKWHGNTHSFKLWALELNYALNFRLNAYKQHSKTEKNGTRFWVGKELRGNDLNDPEAYHEAGNSPRGYPSTTKKRNS